MIIPNSITEEVVAGSAKEELRLQGVRVQLTRVQYKRVDKWGDCSVGRQCTYHTPGKSRAWDLKDLEAKLSPVPRDHELHWELVAK